MSILSRIRSWFSGAKSLPKAPAISETSPQKATKEIEEQKSKAEELIESIKVAHEEQPQNYSVNPIAVQPENIPVPATPKAEESLPSQNIQPIQSDNVPSSIQPENTLVEFTSKTEENMSSNIQPENIFVTITPKTEESVPFQGIQSIQPENLPSQNIESIQPESVLSDIQPIQPENLPVTPKAEESVPSNIQTESKVKRTSRSRSNKPRRSRSRKKLKESVNPET